MANEKRVKEILDMLLNSDFSTFEIAERVGIEEKLVIAILHES